MTSTARTSQRDLVAFIDFLADKGIMNTQTAAGRKSAVNTLLSALDPNETADVTPLDLDEVSKRFMNKRGSAFKPDSVKIYKARVASAIQDFLKYKADPLNFKVGITSKPTTITRTEKNAPAQANPLAQHYPAAGAFFGAPPSLRQPVRDRDRCPDPDSAKHDCQNRGVAERPDQAGGCEARKYYPSLRDRR